MESDFESQFDDMELIDEPDEAEIEEAREELREMRRLCDMGRGPWVATSIFEMRGEGVYVDGEWDGEAEFWYPAVYISTLRRWVRHEGEFTTTRESAISEALENVEFFCETYIPSLDRDAPPFD